MTWSLLALDASGAFGVAIASRFFAVGSLCPGVIAHKGALSTQALMNPLYRHAGLAALAEGIPSDEIVRRLTGEDEGRDVRQFHVLDASGGSAAHTGRSCIDWCGHVSGPGYSIAGNMLAVPRSSERRCARTKVDRTCPFLSACSRRWTRARKRAATSAGGRPRRSSVHTTEEYPFPRPARGRSSGAARGASPPVPVSLERFQAFVGCLPSRAQPAGIVDRAVIEARVAQFQSARRGG
jgi:uncharacterized Ntn-hydrolase superfamily protein